MQGKTHNSSFPKALLPKVSPLEHSQVQWLQMAHFDCSGVWMQGVQRLQMAHFDCSGVWMQGFAKHFKRILNAAACPVAREGYGVVKPLILFNQKSK